jgi:Predicted dehydrogenases and related proteins
MDQLYFGEWTAAPAPADFPGCVTVRVTCACTPGGGSVALRLSPAAKVLHRTRNARRLVASTARHVRRYGVKRTLAIIRRESGALHLRGRTSVACVAGVLEDGTRVVGYRHDAPAFIDMLVMRPEQVARIPAGVADEDACTALHYALALAAMDVVRASGRDRTVAICGQSLACELLHRRLADDGIAARMIRNAEALDPKALRDAVVVVGDAKCLPKLEGTGLRPVYLALDADSFDTATYLRREPTWIGLPHSQLRNLSVYSQLPLELDERLATAALSRALDDMATRTWRPSELLQDTVVRATPTVDLSRALLLRASATRDLSPEVPNPHHAKATGAHGRRIRLACIGLGNWSTDTILPFLAQDARVRLVMGVDHDPMRLERAARLFPFDTIAADAAVAIASPEVDAVLIATQHDTHTRFAVAALHAGKAVFVEKPPVLSYDELDAVVEALGTTPRPFLAAGYNRAHWEWNDMLREQLAGVGPVSISALVRELEIPRTHPYYWPQLGPRVISNGCHWIDLASHLLGDRVPESVQVVAGHASPEANNVVLIRYVDGSLVSLTFSDRGDRRPHVHEYIDIKARGIHYIIDDFQRLLRYDDGWMRKVWAGPAERGWQREIVLAVNGMLGGPLPRPYEAVVTSAMLVLDARRSFEAGGTRLEFDLERLRAYKERLA